MKVNIELNGKTAELDIPDEKLVELGLVEKKKPTGYERVERGHTYNWVDSTGCVYGSLDVDDNVDLRRYDAGEYYSSEKVAEANSRADKLMRKLRRFAAENGGIPSVEDWNDGKLKFAIFVVYDPSVKNGINFTHSHCVTHRNLFNIFFNSEEACKKAIEEFKDELTWYFTEYQARLY